MTTEQKNQQKLIDASLKAQKDAQDADFKRSARQKALSAAQYIRANDTSNKVLEDADKIFQTIHYCFEQTIWGSNSNYILFLFYRKLNNRHLLQHPFQTLLLLLHQANLSLKYSVSYFVF